VKLSSETLPETPAYLDEFLQLRDPQEVQIQPVQRLIEVRCAANHVAFGIPNEVPKITRDDPLAGEDKTSAGRQVGMHQGLCHIH
jgi:hypothetical protein